jgi:[acyl-carrier-protein] S-malonyltransferase
MFALTGEVPEAAGLFDHAAALLGGDPRAVVQTASNAALHHDRIGQLLCALQPLAAAAALGSAVPERRIVAGYSVGEVAAWGVAGLLDATATLNLVARRAGVMDAATLPGDGMLFVRGLSRDAVDRLCARHDAAIAIVEPGDAFILGGSRAGLDALASEAKAMDAKRIVDVQVEVASHTKRLAGASREFREILKQFAVKPPAVGGVRLLSGIDGTPVVQVKAGLDKLAAQISQTVQWADCLQGCLEAGATAFLELGPGSALSRMSASAYRDVEARSLEDFRTLQGARMWLAQRASHSV